MSKRPNPASRYQRAVALMRERPPITRREFARLLGTLCDTKEQVLSLKSSLINRGAVEQVVRLKEPAA